MRTEWRNAYCNLLVAATAFVVLLVLYIDRVNNVALWVDTDHALAYASVLVTPLATGLATWRGGLDRVAGTERLLATSVRAIGRHVVPVATMAAAVAAGLVVSGVVMYLWLLSEGPTYGSPRPQFLLPTLAVATTGVSAGYVVGRLGARLVLAPLMAVAAYLSQWISTLLPEPFPALTPFPQALFAPNAPGNFTMAAAITLTFAGLGVAVGSTSFLRRRPDVAGAVGAVSLAAAIIAGYSAVQISMWTVVDNSDDGMICSSGEPIEVCIHPAYGAVADQILPQMSAVLRPLAGAEGSPSRVRITNAVSELRTDGDADTMTVQLLVINSFVDAEFTVRYALSTVFATAFCDPLLANAYELEGQRDAIAVWTSRVVSDEFAVAPFDAVYASAAVQLAETRPAAETQELVRTHLTGIQQCDPDAIREVVGASPAA